jgi:uncharacterized protein with ParB-like and HNH nuclease domain
MSVEIPRPDRSNLITFLKKTIGGQFVIPVYQRNYTWTASKEVRQYLSDLEAVLAGDFDNHFLGIVIYLINVLDSYGTSEFSVIDGQQRLTTTFLILYAIRDILKENKKDQEVLLLETRILTNQSSEENHRYKLKPLVADDEVYQQIVSGKLDDVEDKESNVYKNFIYIKEKLLSWISSGFTIEDILTGLDKLYIVNVPISENDNAQKIFESINSTGAKLTAADLIRNYILMDLPSDTQDKLYTDYWKKLESNITSDAKKLEAFFRFFLAAKTYSLSNKSAVYREFKVWFNDQKEKENLTIEDIFKEIVQYAKYFNEIYTKPIDDTTDCLKSSLDEFRKNISDMPAPFLMGMYNLYENIDEHGNRYLSKETFSEILDLLNVYLIRRSLSGLDTSDITRLFPKLLKDTLNDCGNDFSNIIEYVKRNLINRNRGKSSMMPDDQFLRSYLKNANAYNIKFTIRIVFEKIENQDNSAPVDQKKLSIEHLLPQTPTDYWLKETKLFVSDEYDKYLNKLGNLTLASKKDNSKMQNNVFEFKKQILKTTSHLTINSDVLDKEGWSKDEIDVRTTSLIDKIIELYPYSSASDEVIVKHDIYLESNGYVAIGYLYEEDGSVEILEGSTLSRIADSSAYQGLEELYSELVEDGIIVETENESVFKKSFLMPSTRMNDTSLSSTASLLCRSGSRNGWEWWKDSEGKALNENKELKNKLTKR